MLATFKRSYGITISAYIIVPVGFLGTIIIGWLDYNYIRKYENEHQNKMNDIKEQLNRIEENLYHKMGVIRKDK